MTSGTVVIVSGVPGLRVINPVVGVHKPGVDVRTVVVKGITSIRHVTLSVTMVLLTVLEVYVIVQQE